MARKSAPNVFEKWYDKINAKRRVKAICKPCWEIKYCPYGPLVEQFPLADDADDRRCRIFGHVCPVFHVAEPFTETKELRNISRSISRPVQFRVLKRENQICRQCGQAVKDEDIHFDHIIPWSKGGSSDEHNVQLLCGDCNRKKSDKLEADFLVDSVRDHLVDSVGPEILDYLLFLVGFALEFRTRENRLPNPKDFARQLNNGEQTEAEEQGARTVQDLSEFFSGECPCEITKNVFHALRLRWGFADGEKRSPRIASKESGVEVEDLFAAEKSVVNRLGWQVSLSQKSKEEWLRS